MPAPAAQAHANPIYIADAQLTLGRAYMEANPGLALNALRTLAAEAERP